MNFSDNWVLLNVMLDKNNHGNVVHDWERNSIWTPPDKSKDGHFCLYQNVSSEFRLNFVIDATDVVPSNP